MSRSNFDAIHERRGTDSIKWAVRNGELPMWVADMDFMTAQPVIDALIKRAEHGIFGYSDVDDDWYGAYIFWWERRHGFKMAKEWLMFCTGVIPAISSTVRKLTTPNENVIIQTPVYNIFFNCIVNNGCRPLENQLIYKGGTYSMDFDDLEKKMADPQTNLMILCNPQNPSGNIWSKDVLSRIGDLAYANGVTVISDEIHCDITRPGTEYIPFLSASETCRKVGIACISPTKAFNIAGIHTAAICVPDVHLRNKVKRAINTDEVAEPGVFATVAAISAFNEGEEWLDGMCEYVFENRRLAEEYINENIPGILVIRGDATYLLWVDISTLGIQSKEAQKIIREKTGLFVNSGHVYGKGGDGFLRINLACPKKTLYDGLDRLKCGIDYLKKRG